MGAEPHAATWTSPEVISSDTVDGRHQLRLRIRSPRDAPNLLVDVGAEDSIAAASVEGVEIDRAGTPADLAGDLELLYAAPPAEGIELELELDGDGRVALDLADISEGVPDLRGPAFEPRPEDMQPLPTQALDPTIVQSSTQIK